MTLTPEGVRVRAAVIEAALGASPLARLSNGDLNRLIEILRTALDATEESASAS